MTSLHAQLRQLDQIDIRARKPGYSDAYYELCEHLGAYAAALFAGLGLKPDRVTGGPGETGAVLKADLGTHAVIARIGIWDGELYTSNVFYAKLAGAGVPAPLVLAYDDSKRVIPFEYQVVEHLEGVDLRQVPEPLRHRAGQLVGEALERVHAIAVDGFGAPLAQGGWSSPTWLEALRTTYFDSSLERKRELFLEDEIAQIESATAFNPRLEVQSPKLIHADVGPGNGLFRVTGERVELAGLIDPGPIIGGDPLIDVPGGDDAFSRGVRSAWRLGWPLDGDALYRHERYQLFFSYWTSCWEYVTGREYLPTRARTLGLLSGLPPPP